ncbi:MAG TPA: NF038104 family lipoprotein [bacterium]|nr:NF038104 family lipoprotein [bacterium]HPN30656.1 NF038104 family lipoprotein [bacterium]
MRAKLTIFLLIGVLVFCLQGCAVVKLPYTAVKTGYKATKTAVKGTAAVGKAIIPGGEDEKSDSEEKK